MIPDIEFSKVVFAFFAALVFQWGKFAQRALLVLFFLFFILKDFPLEVYVLWYVVGSILIAIGDLLLGSS